MSAGQRWTAERRSHWLTTGWAEGFSRTLASLNPEPPASELALNPADPPASGIGSELAWRVHPTNAADGAGISFGCDPATAAALGSLALGDLDDAELQLQTYHELLNQSAACLASALTKNLGREVDVSQGFDVAEPSDATLAVVLEFSLNDQQHRLVAAPNAALLEAIYAAESAVGEPAASTAESAAVAQPGEPVEETAASAPLDATSQRNLNILLDLELDLSVSFGTTEMLLEEVLKLSTGSIVELDRSASDPVEVLVNESIVARGEVVVIDGNYGVRITEVSSRSERLQSIF